MTPPYGDLVRGRTSSVRQQTHLSFVLKRCPSHDRFQHIRSSSQLETGEPDWMTRHDKVASTVSPPHSVRRLLPAVGPGTLETCYAREEFRRLAERELVTMCGSTCTMNFKPSWNDLTKKAQVSHCFNSLFVQLSHPLEASQKYSSGRYQIRYVTNFHTFKGSKC